MAYFYSKLLRNFICAKNMRKKDDKLLVAKKYSQKKEISMEEIIQYFAEVCINRFMKEQGKFFIK